MADIKESVQLSDQSLTATAGTGGLKTQVNGAPATVSAAAMATGGVAAGNFIEADIDQELYKFKSDDTPLMQLMLRTRGVKVASPVVTHYAIDSARATVESTDAVAAATGKQFVLPLQAADASVPRPCGTLLVKGVDGYAADGKTLTPGKELLLYVTGTDLTTGNPVCMAMNGPRDNAADEYCTTPAIPAGTTFVVLSNALYETQKEIEPDLIVPQGKDLFLQKRGMSQIVSDYFDAQKKNIPFSKAVIAEAAIFNFKVRGNRTFWASRQGRCKVQTKLGPQTVYSTEGIRYQMTKELQHSGRWTVEELVALTKMIFTGEDVPKSPICLCGKDFLESIQNIDYSNHPEVQFILKENAIGWNVKAFVSAFGTLEFKHDPTLDRLGWSNSAGIIDPEALVHYVYSTEHSASDRVEGEEATRETIVVWDGLALKGTSHMWVNGEAETAVSSGATHTHYWNSSEAPASPEDGAVYYLLQDCPGISDSAKSGSMWRYKDGAWKAFDGIIDAA